MRYARRTTPEAMTLVEFIVALTIIGIFAAVFSTFLHKAALNAKEITLQHELYNLRLSLDLYQRVKGSYPADLRQLIGARYKLDGSNEILFGKEYLSNVGTDKEGWPLDPFGNRFHYEPEYGAVRSVTAGYERW